MNKRTPHTVPAPPAEVTIEKLVYGGDGLARIDGQVLLTPFVLPGERVEVVPQQSGSGLLRARRPEIIEASPERVVPLCPYFGRCGGCQYQHGAYAFQLQQKEAILRETLQRLGHFQFDGAIEVLSGEEWGYRNRVQLHFADGRVGFHRSGSHTLEPIDHCPISSPKLVEAINTIAKAVRDPQWPRFLRTLEIFTNEADVQLNVTETDRPVAARFFEWINSLIPGIISGPLVYNVLDISFSISRQSFFQVNRFLIGPLVEEALREHSGGSALDLYAGVGLFSLPLANRYEHVDAVERGRSANRDLIRNSEAADGRLSVHEGTAEEYLHTLSNAPNLVVADPPRSGLGPEATADLLRLVPEQLVIVSCDPTTLSRDLARLNTHYEIARMTLVDLFPQTYHFETVVHLRRK